MGVVPEQLSADAVSRYTEAAGQAYETGMDPDGLHPDETRYWLRRMAHHLQDAEALGH